MTLSMHTAGQRRLSEQENFPAVYSIITESAKLLASLSDMADHVVDAVRRAVIFALDLDAVLWNRAGIWALRRLSDGEFESERDCCRKIW
jgi:hypothetical protein